MLLFGKRGCDLAADTVMSDDTQDTQAYVVDAVLTVHHGGDGHGGVGSAKNSFADVAHVGRNGVEGSAFTGDDLTARSANVLFHVLFVKRHGHTVFDTGHTVEFFDRHLRHVGDGPRNKAAVAVLAENVRVDILRVDAAVFGKTSSQTRGIQNSTRTDDSVFRNAGEFASCRRPLRSSSATLATE